LVIKKFKKKLNLVLDLDETLIHALKMLDDDFGVPINRNFDKINK
jgi:TFIIF-interacting CTD phosphatase-like protein